MKSKMTAKLKRKLGQNTAEYMIMLTLVAVGSIGLVTVFGKSVRAKIGMATAALSGETTAYDNSQKVTTEASKEAGKRADDAFTMNGVASSEFADGIASQGGGGGEAATE